MDPSTHQPIAGPARPNPNPPKGFRGPTGVNSTKIGTTRPGEMYILGAHMDGRDLEENLRSSSRDSQPPPGTLRDASHSTDHGPAPAPAETGPVWVTSLPGRGLRYGHRAAQ